MIQAQNAVTTNQVLVIIGTVLQSLVFLLVTWLVKTTRESEKRLERFDVTLFGEKGDKGLVEEFAVFKERDEQMRRTLQRAVFRLGAIEDKLRIPRNVNVNDSEDDDLANKVD